jgi:hypothetical protein
MLIASKTLENMEGAANNGQSIDAGSNFILYFHSYLLAPILNNDKYCIVKCTNQFILPDIIG